MKVKHSIADLYRREWLDIATHVYISALLNLGTVKVDGEEKQVTISAAEAIKHFQKWLNLSEDDLDTDALKSTYYRSQRRFIEAMRSDLKNMRVEINPDAQLEKLIEAAVHKALDKVIDSKTPKRVRKYNGNSQLKMKFEVTV